MDKKIVEETKKEEEVKPTEAPIEQGKEQPEAKGVEEGKTDGDASKGVENVDDKQQSQEQASAQPTVTKEETNEGDTPNGVRVEDVVTRDMLRAEIEEALKPYIAKTEALQNENEQLKEKLANAEKDAKDTHDKYEKGDFGGQAKQGGFGESKVGGNNSYIPYETMWGGKNNFD